jgi:hypothetical protein
MGVDEWAERVMATMREQWPASEVWRDGGEVHQLVRHGDAVFVRTLPLLPPDPPPPATPHPEDV